MKKLFLISAALLAAISSAQSADLPRAYTKAPVMAPVASWTGFYAGVNVGYGFNDPTAVFTANDVAGPFLIPTTGLQASYNVRGVLGGAQAGYNWQVSPNWLLGLETDLQGSDVKGTGTSDFLSAFTQTPLRALAQQNIEWFGTVRARGGLLATDKLLMFATGGLAYGSVNSSASIIQTTAAPATVGLGGFGFSCTGGAGTSCFNGSQDKIQTGYTVGGGFEYAGWQNITFKVEYLYVNLGSTNATTVAIPFGGGNPSSLNVHFSDLDFNVARVGMNYRF